MKWVFNPPNAAHHGRAWFIGMLKEFCSVIKQQTEKNKNVVMPEPILTAIKTTVSNCETTDS